MLLSNPLEALSKARKKASSVRSSQVPVQSSSVQVTNDGQDLATVGEFKKRMNVSEVSDVDSEDLTSGKYVILASTTDFNSLTLTPPIQVVRNNVFSESVVFNSNNFNASFTECNVPADSWRRSACGGEISSDLVNDPADPHPIGQGQAQDTIGNHQSPSTSNNDIISTDNNDDIMTNDTTP